MLQNSDQKSLAQMFNTLIDNILLYFKHLISLQSSLNPPIGPKRSTSRFYSSFGQVCFGLFWILDSSIPKDRDITNKQVYQSFTLFVPVAWYNETIFIKFITVGLKSIIS